MALPTIYTLDPVYVTEGDNTLGSITRTGDTTRNQVLYLSRVPGSAIVGDYANSFQTLTFPAGHTQLFYTILTIDDKKMEGTESFSISLTDSYGGAPLAQTAVTIADNDFTPEVVTSVATPTVSQPATPGTVVSGNGNVVNTGTINYIDNSVTNYNYTDNSTNLNSYSIVTTTTYNGGAKADRLTGTTANDSLAGLKGNDSLTGQGGDDILSGGLGNDRLYGGVGANQLAGGAGKDRYYVTAEGQAENADIIKDLNVGDRIFIQGATRSGLTVNESSNGIGIFNNGVMEALYTGNALSAGQISGMLSAV
jgi:Ca2+-binding RTX toxin-like protein